MRDNSKSLLSASLFSNSLILLIISISLLFSISCDILLSNLIDLKPILIKKDNYILRQEDKDKLEKYINQVDKTNDEYKNIQTLSITLNNVDKGIQENHKQIQTLTENNGALQLRVDTLTKNNKVKDKQIKDLKEENLSLRQSLSFWKDKFLKVISFIKDKLFGKEK